MQKKKQNEEEALQSLSNIYYKIFFVDLTNDTYEIIKTDDETGAYTENFSNDIREFADSEQVHIDDREKYLAFAELDNLRQSFWDGDEYMCCHYRRKVKNEFRWVSMELVPSREYTRDRQSVLLYIKDIHERYARDLEERDMLTGGINRQGFMRQVAEVMERADEDCRFAILFFNIVGFKAINEMFGTDGGDDVLRLVYQHLKDSVLCPLKIARTEGDHYVCLVDQDSLDYELLPDLCQETFVRNDKRITIYIKCGVYLVQDRKMEVSMMCDCAKLAKGYIVDEYLKPYAVFSDSMIDNYLTGTEIRGNLIDALQNEEFQVYYQPIYDTRTKRIVSAEALVRWIHPERGMISPGAFIPVLEETGYVTKVDHFVVKSVAEFVRKRIVAGESVVPISVNLSWMDFYDEELMTYIRGLVMEGEENAVKVRLEVTETSYAALSNREGNVIEELRKIGAIVLLDDFGSGYSSFSTICEYNFDIIKLDMEFTRRIGKDSKIKSIIHSIIDMSHHIGARVIAEGVETLEQLEYLGRHGCDYVQGFYFSKPLPQQEFEKLLHELQEEEGKEQAEPDVTITDLIDVNVLQKIQDSFSQMTGMAALTTNAEGVAVTQGSNFTEFCTKYTRQSELGEKRCQQCDRRGAEEALFNGHACAYECHAGLMDYAAPIMADGRMVGCFIGGQVLTERPNLERVEAIAEELGINPEEYKKAIGDVKIVKKQEVNDAAEFLYTFANILSSVAYSKYKVDVGNKLLLQKNRELDFLASHDSLTKLLNRSRMPEIYWNYKESKHPFCAVLGDVDDFKCVNDTYGHDCGDNVLALITGMIQQQGAKAGGDVCRWGGEEVLMLLPVEMEKGRQIVEKIRREVENLKYEYEGKELTNTMTFGISSSLEADSLEQLVKLADERLYLGKQKGKNQVV